MTTFFQSSVSFALLQTCFESEHYPQYFKGCDTHGANLGFINQLLPYTQDLGWIRGIIGSGLPADYAGDALDEVERIVHSGIQKGFAKGGFDLTAGKKPSAASVLLGLIEAKENVEFFHDAFGRTYMSIKEEGKGSITYRLSSTSAQLWIKRIYYQHTRQAIPAPAFNEVIDTLNAKALFDGMLKPIFLRVARHEDSIVINLADEKGQVVVITREGYRVTTDSPVIFVKSAAMDTLPVPETGGDLGMLQRLLGLDKPNFNRILAFLINCLKPEGPYLVLIAEGEQGSGKSFLCLLLKLLVDPSQAPKLRLPDSDHDLMIQAKDNFLLIFDNISGIKATLSDVLCTLATGASMAKRKLYSDDELQIFTECRPYVLNGITSIANRPDLLERAIAIKLPTMPEGQRKTEEEILREFYEMRPRILGVLFNIIAGALDAFDETIAPTSIRMADAAKWIVAAEPAVGVPEGTLLHALESSQQEVVEERMANNSLAIALAKVTEFKPYDGTIGGLSDLLNNHRTPYDREFPPTAAHLSRTLERLRPALAKTGIMVEFGERKRHGRPIRVWLKKEEGM